MTCFLLMHRKDLKNKKNSNKLRNEDINKIVDTYLNRKDVDKYAHVANLDEIKENEYNLNIPRYVDTFEPEPPVDVDKLVSDMQETDTEIKQLNGEISSLMDDLVGADAVAQQQLDEIKGLFNEK